jgi:hypothetical protein
MSMSMTSDDDWPVCFLDFFWLLFHCLACYRVAGRFSALSKRSSSPFPPPPPAPVFVLDPFPSPLFLFWPVTYRPTTGALDFFWGNSLGTVQRVLKGFAVCRVPLPPATWYLLRLTSS